MIAARYCVPFSKRWLRGIDAIDVAPENLQQRRVVDLLGIALDLDRLIEISAPGGILFVRRIPGRAADIAR